MRARAGSPVGHPLDPGLGFEPRLMEPESTVLPLDDPGVVSPEGFEPSASGLKAPCSPVELRTQSRAAGSWFQSLAHAPNLLQVGDDGIEPLARTGAGLQPATGPACLIDASHVQGAIHLISVNYTLQSRPICPATRSWAVGGTQLRGQTKKAAGFPRRPCESSVSPSSLAAWSFRLSLGVIGGMDAIQTFEGQARRATKRTNGPRATLGHWHGGCGG